MSLKSIKKALTILFLGVLSAFLSPSAYGTTYSTSGNSSSINVITNGDSDVQIKSQSTTNSTNSVQEGINESIHVESNNGDTKSQVIINGKKVYEGNSEKIEVNSNTSTTVKDGEVTDDSESKTTVTTVDGKTTVTVEKNGNSSTVTNNDISAKTELDISVNKSSNKLVIKTGDKTQEIDLLPDEAVNVVIDNNLIDAIKQNNKVSVDISEKNGAIVYSITGIKNSKFFGFLPMSFTRTIEVSAEDGKILSEESPLYTKILTRFTK